MPSLFVFLIKVNLALLVFCAGYYLVLRRLTFYTLNRIYLVGAIVFASVYPRINLSAFLSRHQHIARPVRAIAYSIQAPPEQLIKPIARHAGWWPLAQTAFWLGVIILAIRLLIQFISLYRIYRKSHPGELLGHRVRLIDGDGGPFSFWTNIYVNPKRHEPHDLKAILQHEQVHIDQLHTADILLAELSTIFYWFNPGIWLMKKAIRENIEFITDRKILRSGADSKQYQYSLVNVSFSNGPQTIVNHFNISTIKKRIVMMNAKRSSNLNLTRYAFLVPLVMALLLVFTVSRAALAKKHVAANTWHKSVQPKAQIPVFKVKHSPKLTNAAVAGVTAVTQISADTTMYVKMIAVTDTSKKVHLHYKDVDIITKKPDMYIVDGIITKDYDISKVDTSEIRSINVGTADGKTVVYVETKNGIPSRRINRIRINGHNAETFQGTTINGNIVYIDSLKTKNGKFQLDTVYVNGAIHKMPMTYHVRPFNSNTLRTYSTDNKSITYLTKPGATVYTTTVRPDDDVSFGSLSSKLVIINGNIATKSDLKKLSAFDIDHMVFKTSEEMRELYGDKAKNGVVFILTKKRG